MIRNRKVWIAVAVVGVMVLGGCRHCTPEKMADHLTDEISSELKLDAAQEQQLRSSMAEVMVKVDHVKRSHETMHGEVVAELGRDTLDRGRLKAVADSRIAEMQGVSDLLIEKLVQFHATLTPEQKAKLAAFVKDREDCHHRCTWRN